MSDVCIPPDGAPVPTASHRYRTRRQTERFQSPVRIVSFAASFLLSINEGGESGFFAPVGYIIGAPGIFSFRLFVMTRVNCSGAFLCRISLKHDVDDSCCRLSSDPSFPNLF